MTQPPLPSAEPGAGGDGEDHHDGQDHRERRAEGPVEGGAELAVDDPPEGEAAEPAHHLGRQEIADRQHEDEAGRRRRARQAERQDHAPEALEIGGAEIGGGLAAGLRGMRSSDRKIGSTAKGISSTVKVSSTAFRLKTKRVERLVDDAQRQQRPVEKAVAAEDAADRIDLDHIAHQQRHHAAAAAACIACAPPARPGR